MQQSHSPPTASSVDPSNHEATEERKRRCREGVQQYQSNWKAVPTMTSHELYSLLEERNSQKQQEDDESLWIVDVRSEAERQVSMIQQAMTLSELETRVHHKQPTDPNHKTRVVFYCTIGYRSGMEATHYQQNWKKTHPELECYNLDGIVSFSHVLAEKASTNQSTTTTTEPEEDITSHLASCLVAPSTGEPTWKLHTYGMAWDMGDNTTFTSTYFDSSSLPRQLAHDSYHVSVRFWQRQWHRLTKHG